MKILYIHFITNNEIGVIKKIRYQINSLKNLGHEVEYSEIKNSKYYIKNNLISNFSDRNNIIDKMMRKITKFRVMRFLQKKENISEVDLIYIRYYLSSYSFYKLLKNLKNFKKKIIIEIATYPYDMELEKGNIFNFLDKIYRKKIYKYVDKVVTYSEDKKIWNIPCINISNGIDLDKIKLIEKKQHKNINFISVSNCSFWHGIDRFLYSLIHYRRKIGKEAIKFYIVGEGNETSRLKKIVEDNLELHDIVIFYGVRLGQELDEIYNDSDIAVGSLGRFRSGVIAMKTLKNREYCAKGLPMIYSEIDLDFEGQNFIYKVSHDENLIDIQKIIEWYKNLRVSSNEIREYSKQFSWDIQMKKVLDEIKQN